MFGVGLSAARGPLIYYHLVEDPSQLNRGQRSAIRCPGDGGQESSELCPLPSGGDWLPSFKPVLVDLNSSFGN